MAAVPSQARRARSTAEPLGRSAAVKAALEQKRIDMADPGFHPCLWCAAVIPVDRVKNAIARGLVPKYCGEPCRRHDPAKSLVIQIYTAALGASRDDESKWRERFALGCGVALEPTISARDLTELIARKAVKK